MWTIHNIQGKWILAAWIVGAVLPAYGAGITPDGTTATTVTMSGGRPTINIAPAVSGVSHNTYTDFNVGTAGVSLNNIGVNARNIVNQVTSTNPSLIQGDITVIGSRANVVIANPNGITVNGGSFINTGNVALTTGVVSFNDITLSPGNVQRNVVLNTSNGQIVIGAAGLSGAILDLELIAKQITVNGPVLNSVTNNAARIRTVAGASHSEIDGSVSPTDLLSTWIGHTAPGTSAAGTTALDITSLGSLTAGRVELIITEQGAGVRHAGSIYANVGDFTIAGNGDLHVDGGHIKAVNDVVIANASVDSQAGAGISSIQAGRTVDIQAGKIAFFDTAISAGTRATDASGNLVVLQRGNVLIGADGVPGLSAISLSGTQLDATGGIAFYNQGQSMSLGGSQLAAEQDIILKAGDLSAFTSSAGAASIISKTGTVTFNSSAAVTLAGAAVSGAAGVSINASSFSAAAYAGVGSVSKSAIQSLAGDVNISTAQGTSLTGTDLFAANNVLLANGGFSSANEGSQRTTVVASTGGLIVNSSADISSIGSLLQGNSRIAGNTGSLGAVTLTAAGRIFNRSPSEAVLGAIFGKADDVVLNAGGDIENRNSRIISNRRLSLTTGGAVYNIIDKIPGARGEQASSYSGTSTRWLVFSERSIGFDVDYGQVTMPGQLAYLVAESGMDVHAANFANQGGIGLVNGGDMNIAVTNKFRNEALLTGSAHFKRSCMIFCSASASSNVTTYGGSLSASGNININAGQEAANIGGNVLALGDLTVTAPVIYAQGVTGYRAYSQSGMKTWFGSSWARLYATDIGGSWLAANKLKLNGQGVIDGGSFTGMAELVANNGIVSLRTPQRGQVSIENSLGLGSGIW